MGVHRAAVRLGSSATALLLFAGVVWCAAPAGAASAWVVQAHPRPPAVRLGVLNGVACPSATNCTAVGVIDNATAQRTLVEHWNGSSWAMPTSRNPATAVASRLLGVTCPTPTVCVAVGTADGRPLVEQSSGATWSLKSVPGSVNGQLAAVSCTSTTNCIAVGDDGAHPIALRWNG